MKPTVARRSVSAALVVALFVLALSACSDVTTSGVDARSIERAALEAANPFDVEEVFDPTGWEMIGPDVWLTVEYDDEGRKTGEEMHAQGGEAFEWLLNVYFPERILTIEAQLEGGVTGVERIALEGKLVSARRFVSRVGEWGVEAASDSIVPAQSCTPSAKASAGRASVYPGARASASGRNCHFYQSGWVDSYAFAGGNSDADFDWMHQYGDSASVFAVAYGNVGTACYSRGEAVGYPNAYAHKEFDASCQ